MLFYFLALFLILKVHSQAETSPPISVPYRIQGTIIFPNGTSVYADHELPSNPVNLDENLLFRGLFQLVGNLSLGPIIRGDSQESNTIRGSVLFPDGRRLRAHRKILPKMTTKLESSAARVEQDEHYIRNGSLGAHVFTISETERLRLVAEAPMGQVKVGVDNIIPRGTVKGANSYYLEKERLGAFVYTEGAEQESRLVSSQSSIAESCRFSFTQPAGKRGQYWLLRSKPCGNLPRLITTLPDGTNLHFYGVPVLVDL